MQCNVYITLHSITLQYITWPHITLHYITLHHRCDDSDAKSADSKAKRHVSEVKSYDFDDDEKIQTNYKHHQS